MPPIRVLHLARIINRNDFIDTIVRYLPRDRFSLEVATFDRKAPIAPPMYEEVGIPHHLIPVRHMRAYPSYVLAAFKLRSLLKKRQIQILHTHHYWEGIVGALAKLLYPPVKFILHRHYTEDITRITGIKNKVLLKLELFSHKMADKIIVSTNTMKKFIESFYNTSKLPPIEVIPYGFAFQEYKYYPPSPVERERVRREMGISESTVVIANLGTHRQLKNQIMLLKAFSRLYKENLPVGLWFIGEGPDTKMLQQFAQEREIPVTFFGWKKAEEVRLLVGAADIIAHTSYSEAFPQVMVEALALERALVITAVSGAQDWLRHREHAWLIPVGDENALYEGLRTLISSPETRHRLGTAGALHVKELFEHHRVNSLYAELYESLCSL
ncbi:MAG: glycosyltransferase [Bacteroidia bacterium]|nr:glycosyltransferase [Bacteroidia bacterium]MDW8133619.1 glycosyltransferase [Bacteroidia bacterium]